MRPGPPACIFSNVDTVDPASIHWSSIRFQRNNNAYRMLISRCQLVLEGMLLTTDDGEYRLAIFIDKQRMNRLYEKFILEYYNLYQIFTYVKNKDAEFGEKPHTVSWHVAIVSLSAVDPPRQPGRAHFVSKYNAKAPHPYCVHRHIMV